MALLILKLCCQVKYVRGNTSKDIPKSLLDGRQFANGLAWDSGIRLLLTISCRCLMS